MGISVFAFLCVCVFFCFIGLARLMQGSAVVLLEEATDLLFKARPQNLPRFVGSTLDGTWTVRDSDSKASESALSDQLFSAFLVT